MHGRGLPSRQTAPRPACCPPATRDPRAASATLSSRPRPAHPLDPPPESTDEDHALQDPSAETGQDTPTESPETAQEAQICRKAGRAWPPLRHRRGAGSVPNCPINSQQAFKIESYLKFLRKCKGPKAAQTILKKEDKVGGFYKTRLKTQNQSPSHPEAGVDAATRLTDPVQTAGPRNKPSHLGQGTSDAGPRRAKGR